MMTNDVLTGWRRAIVHFKTGRTATPVQQFVLSPFSPTIVRYVSHVSQISA